MPSGIFPVAIEQYEHGSRMRKLLVEGDNIIIGTDYERFQTDYDYAVRHRDIIARFGRFPHRNIILGRPSTDEELEFLTQPGSSF